MSDEMREDGHLPATKADLRDFATKADLRHFATKTDLDRFATKDDLAGFATKSDIAEIRELLRPIATIAMTVAHHSAELADIRSHIKDKMVTRDEFHSRMDGFAGRVKDFDYSAAKNLVRLDDHEKRIDALEKRA